MITFPNAKLNLGLNVLRRRSDGYHDLESLFIPYRGLLDVLEMVPAKETSLHLYGIPPGGAPEDNLVFKAWEMMHGKFGVPPVEIHLWKGIPSGAGLGGGSADAAYAVAMLGEMFLLRLQQRELAELAATLGSDCPFFIFNRPMLVRGRGEILSPYSIDLSAYRIEVVKPDISVFTREAYAGIRPHQPEIPLEKVLALPVEQWKGRLCNDFEESLFPQHPEIAAAKEEMYSRGAIYAAMTGSGSAVLGIFRKND